MKKKYICYLLILIIFISCSETGDSLIDRGNRNFDSKEYEKAIESFEEGLKLELENYEIEEIYTMIGNAYLELDKYDEAIFNQKKAIEINPDYHKPWVNIGVAYRLNGDYDEAERCYLKALEIKPDYAELHVSLGALYIFKEETEKAIIHLRKAIELNRDLPVAHSNLALALAYMGEFDEAEASLKKAVFLGYENGESVKNKINNLKKINE